MRPEPKSAEQLQKAVKDFNRDFPVGTPVILRKDFGKEVKTKVAGIAFVLGGHSAMAFFEGVSGCYSIDGRVRHAKH